jgi:hypothetical protein
MGHLMGYVSRNWHCSHCHGTFHSFEPNPECPACGCVNVAWVPGGGHVLKHNGVDRTVRNLADQYGMTNVNTPSPSRLNRAMPKYDGAVADGPVLNFAPGFSAPVSTQGRATCDPSVHKVDFKARVAAESAIIPQQRRYPNIGAANWMNVRQAYKR